MDIIKQHIQQDNYVCINLLTDDILNLIDACIIILHRPNSNSNNITLYKKGRTGVIPIIFDEKHIYVQNNQNLCDIKEYINRVLPYIGSLNMDTVDDRTGLWFSPLYGGNFGHQMCYYLSIFQSFFKNDIDDMKIILYPTYDHINQLVDLFLRTVGSDDKMRLKTNTIYYFNELCLMNIKVTKFPTVDHKNIIEILMKPIKYHSGMPERISFLKTTTSKLMSGIPKGCFNTKVNNHLQIHNFNTINHENLTFEEILFYLKNCKMVIFSWGASSYFNIFLRNDQKCLSLLHQMYVNQLKTGGYHVCFDKRLFNNFTISQPLTSDPNKDLLKQIITNFTEDEFIQPV